MPRTLQLTARECFLIDVALTIASEDGSIYGGADTDQEMEKINREVETIRDKLNAKEKT